MPAAAVEIVHLVEQVLVGNARQLVHDAGDPDVQAAIQQAMLDLIRREHVERQVDFGGDRGEVAENLAEPRLLVPDDVVTRCRC